ncbi:MAG: vitamin K epoxide reductase family protein [Anaerolineales bacterium]|nr:MAG: vitamin K epoxide reductase family protein [Anaerolineales bacterium]
MKKTLAVFSLLILASLLVIPSAHAQTPDAVVRAVFFYSPSCGHCHYVIENTFPPLLEKYGDQLQIVGVDVTQPDGQKLFLAALQKFGLESSGVPFLVVGNIYLIGSADIPERFPALIETHLAQGGIDWPDISGLPEYLGISAPQTQLEPADSTQTATTLPIGDTATWQEKFSRDPVGNSLAVVVLFSMFTAVLWGVGEFRKTTRKKRGVKTAEPISWNWYIPVLSLIGIVVAGYLAYVETAHVTAVCGPVGDCNTVQQSAYARLFGVLPIGVLGLIGYIAIAIAWILARYSKGTLSNWSTVALLAFSAFGTLFSIYLTFLEPFVIGATCAWCITSAILITIIMLLSIRPGKFALRQLKLV